MRMMLHKVSFFSGDKFLLLGQLIYLTIINGIGIVNFTLKN